MTDSEVLELGFGEAAFFLGAGPGHEGDDPLGGLAVVLLGGAEELQPEALHEGEAHEALPLEVGVGQGPLGARPLPRLVADHRRQQLPADPPVQVQQLQPPPQVRAGTSFRRRPPGIQVVVAPLQLPVELNQGAVRAQGRNGLFAPPPQKKKKTKKKQQQSGQQRDSPHLKDLQNDMVKGSAQLAICRLDRRLPSAGISVRGCRCRICQANSSAEAINQDPCQLDRNQ